MIPKKAKEFKKDVAQELGLSEEMVSCVIDFYWETVRRRMTNLSDPAIEIPNFGIFRVKHWAIDEEIEKLKRVIESKEGKFTQYELKRDLEEKIAALEKIKAQVAEEKEKFKNIKQARYAKQIANNMEEPEAHLGGSEEQDLQDRHDRGCLPNENEDLPQVPGD